MRTLMINSVCRQGSTGKIVYDLYEQLRADGHEAAICYGRGSTVSGENIYKFGLDWETNIHAGLARVTGLNGCFSPFSTRRLIRFMEEFRPDVVHIHELHAYFVNLRPVIRYLKRKKIRVIWTFHCEYMYTGKCGYAYECEGWLGNCGNCPAVRDYPKSLCFDFTRTMLAAKKKMLEGLDVTVVTPSQWLADRVKRSFLKDRDIRVIHNGIDADHVFYPRSAQAVSELKERNGLTGKKIVLAVAPDIMSQRKGGKTVVEISEKFAGENVHFVLIGADRNQTIGDHVTLIKRTTNQEELALWYSAADVFLICSKRENFPTTCLEAFCCGTPVVGIDEGGTKETVPDPYGVFCQPEDKDGLEQAIRLQMGKDKPTEEIRELSYRLYNKNAMYRAYAGLYQAKETAQEG